MFKTSNLKIIRAISEPPGMISLLLCKLKKPKVVRVSRFTRYHKISSYNSLGSLLISRRLVITLEKCF